MNIYTTEYWAHYGAGTTAGVSRAKEAADWKQYFVTGVYGYVDQATNITILDGSTVVARWDFTEASEFSFTGLLIPITPGAGTSAVIDDSTAGCAVTIQGYSLPASTEA